MPTPAPVTGSKIHWFWAFATIHGNAVVAPSIANPISCAEGMA
jgi:hypothetical protein